MRIAFDIDIEELFIDAPMEDIIYLSDLNVFWVNKQKLLHYINKINGELYRSIATNV